MPTIKNYVPDVCKTVFCGRGNEARKIFNLLRKIIDFDSFLRHRKYKAFENRRFSMCQNKNFDNMQTQSVCCYKIYDFVNIFL